MALRVYVGSTRGRLSALLLALALTFPALATSADPEVQPGDTWVEDRAWSADVTVSQAAGVDGEPAVWADENLTATVVWKANRSNGESWWVGRTNTTAPQPGPGAFVSNRTEGAWGPNYTYGLNVAVDSQGRVFHVFALDNTTYYLQKDASGRTLVGPLAIVVGNGNRILNPAIDVFPNGTAAVAYENATGSGGGSREIDILLVDPDGNTLWGPVRATTDSVSNAFFPSVAVNRWNGDIVITFRSLAWMVTRFSGSGVKAMASQDIGAGSGDQAIRPVPMPNGNIELFWASYGGIRLSVFNRSGQPVVESRQVSGSAARNATAPQAAALGDGRAVVVWSDNRTGTPQLHYATVRPGHEGDRDPPPNIAVTNRSEGAASPWIAADPWDNLHLAWADGSGSASEVRYKRSFQCGARLGAEPVDIAAMFFMRPGESKNLSMRLENTGYWAANLTLELNVTGTASLANWSTSLNRTTFPSVPRGGHVLASLQVGSAAQSIEGDNISVAVRAHTNCSVAAESAIAFPTYIQYPRGVVLSFDQANLSGGPGDTVQFNGTVRNTGDFSEQFWVGPVAGTSPAGVLVVTNVTTLTLAPDQTARIAALVSVPADAASGLVIGAQVTAYSEFDNAIRATSTVRVLVNATVELALDAHPDLRTAAAGSNTSFRLDVTNTGNIGIPVLVRVELQGAPISFALSKDEIWLAGARQARVSVSAQVPAAAKEGDVFTVGVVASVPGFEAAADVRLTVVVDANRSIGVDWGQPPTIGPGSNANVSISISNEGAAPEGLEVRANETAGGWVRPGEGPSDVLLPGGGSVSMEVGVQPPNGEPPGTKDIIICLCNASHPPLEVVLRVTVPAVVAISLEAEGGSETVMYREAARYALRLQANGNEESPVAFQVTGLPAGATWVLRLTDPYRSLLSGHEWNESTGLTPRSTANLTLIVQTSEASLGGRYHLQVTASTPGGQAADALLELNIYDADLRVTAVTLEPQDPSEGERAWVTVRVANDQRTEKRDVSLLLLHGGQFFANTTILVLGAGEEAEISFPWNATSGPHTFTAMVDPIGHGNEPWGAIREVNEGNNEVSATFWVGGGPGLGPPPINTFWLPLMLVVAAAAALSAFALRRLRTE